MENLKTVSALVKNILEHDHKARNTDNHLYLMVLEHYSGLRGIDIHAMTVPVFLKELDRRSFPGFETVRRSRQKVQATYPDLAPSEAVGKRRAKNEVVYPPPTTTSSPALLYSRPSTRADKRWPRVRKGLNVHRMI